MRIIYDLGVRLYHVAIHIAALFNHKARLLVKGRKETINKLSYMRFDKPVIWFHAASLGEFEQGRPLIESIKKKHPEKLVLLTFFSPSGYEVRKNYLFADYVFYLPGDTRKNAARFIGAIKPEMAFFIKYEFWFHYLKELHTRQIPVYGVSVIFREHQPFFKWYGGWFRQILGFYARFYLQDKKSLDLLGKAGYSHAEVCGDTRFDRVFEIASACKEVEIARLFVDDCDKVIVAGSTWYKDEQLLAQYINTHPNAKLILVPHEVHEEHINKTQALFKVPVFRYTQAPHSAKHFQVMIVNTIGLLSSLYRYGNLAYIGGGFGKGIHNTLEAATFGKPVVFGPNYKKFKEANDLIEKGSGFPVWNYDDLNDQLTIFFSDKEFMEASGESAYEYVNSMRGATKLVMKQVFGEDIE
ncbi:MAG: glycosyltransferase N-terminal domain-containing protein [Breznakibacter sp.]